MRAGSSASARATCAPGRPSFAKRSKCTRREVKMASSAMAKKPFSTNTFSLRVGQPILANERHADKASRAVQLLRLLTCTHSSIWPTTLSSCDQCFHEIPVVPEAGDQNADVNRRDVCPPIGFRSIPGGVSISVFFLRLTQSADGSKFSAYEGSNAAPIHSLTGSPSHQRQVR